MKKVNKYFLIMFYVTLTCVYSQTQGPVTSEVNTHSYKSLVYVSQTGNDDKGNGTKLNPWKTITYAISKIEKHDSNNRTAVLVAEGKYTESTITMKKFVDLYGGFSAKTWERNIFNYMSVITADGGIRAVNAADNCTIDGFSFRKNIIRGQGAAIYCGGTSPVISNNTFINNKTLGPEIWNPKFMHERANDGGAIACENNSSPKITNNTFYKNNTENGRGAAIAFNNNCGGEIINNVFINNVTGMKDPMRSSDGGAVSIFNWCNPLIENNVFVENESLASNDAGALFVALWCSPEIIKNIFVGSKSGDDAGALFVGGQEHRYDSPLDPIPPKDKFFVTIDRNLFVGNQNPSQNSGIMRFTMEARGSFTNNICFNNNGLYFQRCEAQIYNNTVLENFLLIETKEGLGKNYVTNNIIWGNMTVDAPSEFKYNDLKTSVNGDGNISIDPAFINDSFRINPLSVSFDNTNIVTNLYVSGAHYKPGSLVGRIIYAGGNWGVVKSNDENNISVWGNFSGDLDLFVLQTLSLSENSPCLNSGAKIENVQYDYFGNTRPAGSHVDIGAIEIK